MEQNSNKSTGLPEWYALRDFRPANTRQTAYDALRQSGVDCYTPMIWKIAADRTGRRRRVRRPVIADLLFAKGTREELDPVIKAVGRLQYRFRRGAGPQNLMIVPMEEMERFIAATQTDERPIFFRPNEITPSMYGREIKINGGSLHGVRGRLLKMRGSRTRRLIVEIPDFLIAAVEVEPDFIELI